MKKILLTIMTLSIVSLLITSVSVSGVNAQNITGTNNDNDNDDECFGSDADFCGGADYIPNERKNSQEKEDDNNNNNNNKQSSDKGKITVGYGDVGTYYGKGKIVIKNLDTGETLVTKKLNFAKQHHNQGDDCCVKVYTFDKSNTDKGDDIFVKVTGGGGSWETAPYNYKNNLRISISLEEIGEDVDGNYINIK